MTRAVGEINYDARITTMMPSCRASPKRCAQLSRHADKHSMPRNSRAARAPFSFRFTDSVRGLNAEHDGPEIIRQRSSNNTFRGVKTRPFCVDLKLRRCSGVKRGIIRRGPGVSHPDDSRCVIAPCNLPGRRRTTFRQFGTGDDCIPVCLRVSKEKGRENVAQTWTETNLSGE